MVFIGGLDKAEVLKALYDNSHVQGMGFLQAVPFGTVTVDHCRELLKNSSYFDYLYGRVLKVDLSGDKFDERLYDRDNGPGSAGRAIAPLVDKFKCKRSAMDFLVGHRAQGKTTRLIQMSAAGEGTIVVFSEKEVQCIKDQAKKMGLDIPDPISWRRFIEPYRSNSGPYLVDELGAILTRLGVSAATIDSDHATFEPLALKQP